MFLLRYSILLAWSSTLSGAIPIPASNDDASAVSLNPNKQETSPEEVNADNGQRKKSSWHEDVKLFSPGGVGVVAGASGLTGLGVWKVMNNRMNFRLQQQQQAEHLQNTDQAVQQEGWRAWDLFDKVTSMDICLYQQEEYTAQTKNLKIVPDDTLQELWQICRKQFGVSSDPNWVWARGHAKLVASRRKAREDMKNVEVGSKETAGGDKSYSKSDTVRAITSAVSDGSKSLLSNAGPNIAASVASIKQNTLPQLQRMAVEGPKAMMRSRPMLRPA